MESNALLNRIDDLDGSLENLEQVLKPILDDSLNAATRKLPLLDRAKLNVTVVYAIESLLFSYLRLNGVNAKEHQVFNELNRVKKYFEKVKEADEKHTKRNMTLNQQAVARMITHSLAGNGTPDMQQRAKQLKELIMAKKNSKSVTPVSSAPPVAEPSPNEALQAAELLDSVSRELEMQDQEGSEEGEIDERSEPHPILPSTPQLQISQDHPSRRKRRHNDLSSARIRSGDRAEKKARKKAKKTAKSFS